jgi:hypothetical protein
MYMGKLLLAFEGFIELAGAGEFLEGLELSNN